MITEANSTEAHYEADVCLVGSGAAGIALAVLLAREGQRVILLEQGGAAAERSDRPIHQVLPGQPVTLGPSCEFGSFLGGNTNHWYGNCRPLDPTDLERRDQIGLNGWPFELDELEDDYREAQSLLGLGSVDAYDAWHSATLLDAEHKPIDSSILETRVVQTTPEFSMAVRHREALAASEDIQVLLGVRVHGVRSTGSTVTGVVASRADGTPLSVDARHYVLAGGGVENARMLMESDDLLAGEMRPSADVVGRYFQEHWYYAFETRRTHRRHGGGSLRLYDVGNSRDLGSLGDYRQDVDGAHVWAQLVLSPSEAERLATPGLALWFQPSWIAPPELTDLKNSRGNPAAVWAALKKGVRHPLQNTEYVARKLLRDPRPSRFLTLIVQVEQLPDPTNRLTFSGNDATLHLDLDEQQRDAHARAIRHAANELGFDGPALAAEMERKYLLGDFDYFWHHMGTTRMGVDPTTSVVDADCRVHGFTNLFVAGSSVFPTSGTAGPTLTIVALASRLTRHIASLEAGAVGGDAEASAGSR
ncbi:FAD-dependent oxidoreductase [Luteimicrobium sp. DT211]|uniref:FAD-dependent oxidoreductase n=1 Tax=Luteimicrobium sp. DT211 TaxID=3393412 RepID=UPI003CF6CC9F